MNTYRYFQPNREFGVHGESLPHWQQGDVMQFVTIRLKDSLPDSLRSEWRDQRSAWLARYPRPWTPETKSAYHRQFSKRVEEWLDQGMGSCLFRHADARRILISCLMRFDGERVRHQAWVIMPNHVHLLFSPFAPMEKLVQAWKSQSARLLGRGPIWQRDYFDTMIRDAGHYANVLRYIRRNPAKAKLGEGMFTLWERKIDGRGGQDVRRPLPSG